jgi:hypothetical protein
LTKLCNGQCVQVSDPQYGCGEQACAACALDHATEKCQANACAILACEGSYQNCNGADADGCEVNTQTDVNHCGACNAACPSVSQKQCIGAVCHGPCGPIPQDGKWYVCVVYPHPNNPTAHVGLAGGAAPPGQSIQNVWNDPYNLGCIAPTSNQDWVLCPVAAGNALSGTVVQFRHGLHPDTQSGTMVGTWGCGNSPGSCTGAVYVYTPQKTEPGKMENGTTSGILTTVPNFNPPNLLDLQFTIP